MFPHSLTLQVTWTRGERRISPRTATIAWTRVHAIIKSTRAKKRNLSGCDQRLTCCHVEPLHSVRSSSRVHRIRVIGRLQFFAILVIKEHRVDRDLTVLCFLRFIGRSRCLVEELHDRSPIEPRSRRDRAAIVERSMRNQLHDRQTGCREDLQRDRRPIDARSGHDRGRSWSIPAKSVARKKRKSWRN